MTKCPMCGYSEVGQSKVQHHVMNHYINIENPEDVQVINHHEELVHQETTGKTLARSDVYNKYKVSLVKKVLPKELENQLRAQQQNQNVDPNLHPSTSSAPVALTTTSAVASGILGHSSGEDVTHPAPHQPVVHPVVQQVIASNPTPNVIESHVNDKGAATPVVNKTTVAPRTHVATTAAHPSAVAPKPQAPVTNSNTTGAVTQQP